MIYIREQFTINSSLMQEEKEIRGCTELSLDTDQQSDGSYCATGKKRASGLHEKFFQSKEKQSNVFFFLNICKTETLGPSQ